MSLINNDDLYNLALQAISSKGNPSADLKEEMIIEVMGLIEDSINLEILSRMTKEQMDNFNTLLEDENTSDEMIVQFLKDSKIDIDMVNSVALTKFRIAYLGA